MDKKAIHEPISEAKSTTEPLVVLRYLKRRMIVTIMASLILVPMTFYGLFVHVARSTFELIMAKAGALVFLSIVIPALADMLLLKEMRLYKNKIVKVWKLIGAREMELAKVGLACENTGWGFGKKVFFKQGRNSCWDWVMRMFRITGISYNEIFADKTKVKELNSLLAALSGRSPEEFEQTVIMESLIKEDVRHQSLHRPLQGG